jgi:hypothetical protein
MCTEYFHHIHPMTSFPCILPLLIPFLYTHPPSQDLFGLPVLVFVKKMTFLFVEDSYIGCFIVIFLCIYVLSPELVHPLYFSSFYLNSFLMVISTGLKILYSFLYREYINHIHLNFSLLPSLLIRDLS